MPHCLVSLCVTTQTADLLRHRLGLDYKLFLQLNKSVRKRQGSVSRQVQVLMTRESLIELQDEAAMARRESDNAGDVYYRTITQWMVSRLRNGSGRKCYELAMAYDRSIDRLIDRLKSQVISAASRRSIVIATEHKSLLKSDLEYLRNADACSEGAPSGPGH